MRLYTTCGKCNGQCRKCRLTAQFANTKAKQDRKYTFSKCVSILLTQVSYLLLCSPCLSVCLYHISPRYLINYTTFNKRIFNPKITFFILYKNSFCIASLSKKISSQIVHIYVCIYVYIYVCVFAVM